MSRTFKHKASFYKLGRYNPTSVELDRSGLGRYRALSHNPIYYYNAIQFKGGGFYRAVLGYELLWDRKAEADLILGLDYVLHKHEREGSYFLDSARVTLDCRVHGVRWPNGIKPAPLYFDLQWPLELQKGEKLIVRINLLDKPYHVDLERVNGEVFSLSYTRYLNAINGGWLKAVKGVKPHEARRSTKTANGRFKGREGKSLSLVKRAVG